MKRSEREKLLREVLSDENLERVREASLAQGLRAARRRRHRRSFIAGAATLFVALMVLLVKPRPEAHWQRTAAPAQRTSGRVTIINDEQLLAVFSDRPLALVGRAGAQRLVFLDQDVSSNASQ